MPTESVTTIATADKPPGTVRRGRPKGSRNRPKPPERPPVLAPVALRVDDAARYLSISPTTIRRAIRDGRLETRRIGSALLIPVRSLDALLERGA